MVEQAEIQFQLERRQHDRQPPRALDRAQIGQPERHLGPGGLAMRSR